MDYFKKSGEVNHKYLESELKEKENNEYECTEILEGNPKIFRQRVLKSFSSEANEMKKFLTKRNRPKKKQLDRRKFRAL